MAWLALGGLTGCMTLGGRPGHDALTAAEHLKLGAAYEHGGELDLALREYERAATGPVAAVALTCQGNIYSARQDIPAAEARYRAALALDADNLFALNNLAWLLAHHTGSLVEAEQLIRHALALKPEPRAPYEDTLQVILDLKRRMDDQRPPGPGQAAAQDLPGTDRPEAAFRGLKVGRTFSCRTAPAAWHRAIP